MYVRDSCMKPHTHTRFCFFIYVVVLFIIVTFQVNNKYCFLVLVVWKEESSSNGFRKKDPKGLQKRVSSPVCSELCSACTEPRVGYSGTTYILSSDV